MVDMKGIRSGGCPLCCWPENEVVWDDLKAFTPAMVEEESSFLEFGSA
jgi:hypothetical protein